jgi:hypothetical protein
MTCYVCGNDIRGEAVILRDDIARHRRCEPGSARYMRNRQLRNRFLRDLRMTWTQWRREFGRSVKEA